MSAAPPPSQPAPEPPTTSKMTPASEAKPEAPKADEKPNADGTSKMAAPDGTSKMVAPDGTSKMVAPETTVVKTKDEKEEKGENDEDDFDGWYKKKDKRGDPHDADQRYDWQRMSHEWPILNKFLMQQRMRREFFESVENIDQQQKEFNSLKDSHKEKFLRPTWKRKHFYTALKNTMLIFVLGSMILFCFVAILTAIDVMHQQRLEALGSSGTRLLDLIKIAYPDVFQKSNSSESYWVIFTIFFICGSYASVRFILRVEEAKFGDYMMQCERRYRHCVAIQDMRRHDMDNNFDATLNHAILEQEINNKKAKKGGKDGKAKGPKSTNQ